jgi:hypothetical protein
VYALQSGRRVVGKVKNKDEKYLLIDFFFLFFFQRQIMAAEMVHEQ